MSPLKLFVWEGSGISDAYHDDGTLVVLAHTAEEARRVVLEQRREREKQAALWHNEKDLSRAELEEKYPLYARYDLWDGKEEALQREPDEVLEIDEPKIVAFNGGGYD